jgi:hypothetical protein
MDKHEKIYLQQIKKDIRNIQYLQDDQYEETRLQLFQNIVKNLSLIKDNEIYENLKKFIEKQNTIDAELLKKKKEVYNLQKQMYEMEETKNKQINEFYDQFLLKL